MAALRRRLAGDGMANGTVKRYLATLRSMFNLALKWGLYEGKSLTPIRLFATCRQWSQVIENSEFPAFRLFAPGRPLSPLIGVRNWVAIWVPG